MKNTVPQAHVDDAPIVAGVQIDLCAGRALAVPDGETVVPLIHEWTQAFHAAHRVPPD